MSAVNMLQCRSKVAFCSSTTVSKFVLYVDALHQTEVLAYPQGKLLAGQQGIAAVVGRVLQTSIQADIQKAGTMCYHKLVDVFANAQQPAYDLLALKYRLSKQHGQRVLEGSIKCSCTQIPREFFSLLCLLFPWQVVELLAQRMTAASALS